MLSLLVLATLAVIAVGWLSSQVCHFVPCDADHVVRVENHRAKTYTVYVGGRTNPDAFRFGEVQPCSSVALTSLLARPPDAPMSVLARAADGDQVSSPEEVPSFDRSRYAYVVDLVIPASVEADCPIVLK